ncbi:Tn3 family transposase [Nocardia brevicatena]|uniref:Tn3 family transposase n=1 Tax=Nocardia brevicatena TaxID=37327 RepID=UPI003F68960C
MARAERQSKVTRMVSRDGNPTSLGQAIAHYGRVFKTLHILRMADDEPYRREAKAQSNLQEGRHDLGRAIFHGRKGEITRGYLDGMENQLSALGLILNCVVLWNSVYLDRALDELRAQDYPVRDEDATRLSAFVRNTSGSKATTAFTCRISAAAIDHYVIRTLRTRTTELHHRPAGREPVSPLTTTPRPGKDTHRSIHLEPQCPRQLLARISGL